MHARSASLRAAVIVAALAVAITGCTDHNPTVTAPVRARADVQHASIDTAATGGMYLDVRLSQAAMIQLRYWPLGGGDTLERLVLRSASRDRVFLSRLRPDRDYRYDVRALNTAGDDGKHAVGSFHSRPLPPDLADVAITMTGEGTRPLSMLQLNGTFRGIVALDGDGTPVWWSRTQGGPQGWTRRTNGNYVVNDAGAGLYEIAPDGRVVHAIDATTAPALAKVIHHDVLTTPDNHVLFLAEDARTVHDTTLTGDAIWEWTPETGQLVKHNSTFDFLDPALDVGTHSIGKDWVHANSLSYGTHGNLILSLNWISEVVSIAPNFGSVEWRLGGRRSSFALAADATFQGQHTVAQLSNGHILMFDNGRDRTGAARASRALEIVLDTNQKTARRAWSYEPSPAIYAPYVGSARRLANGNTVVHFGLSQGIRGATGPVNTVEVTRAGAVVSRTVVTGIGGTGVSYRNEPFTSIAGERALP